MLHCLFRQKHPCTGGVFDQAGTFSHVRREGADFALSVRSGRKKQCLTPPRRRKESFPLAPKIQRSRFPFSPSRTTQNLTSALPCGRVRTCSPSRRQRPSTNSKGANSVRRYSSTQISPFSKRKRTFFPRKRQRISFPVNHAAPPRPAAQSSLPQAIRFIFPRYTLSPCGRPQGARPSSDRKAPPFSVWHIPKAPPRHFALQR